jgi:hypothetical protein
MAGSKAWPALREISLLDPDAETDGSKKRLAAVADEAAGREAAVYRWGYPETFPFAADIGYGVLPGYLPDGRMAMGAADARTTPPTLCVITFDGKGRQTKKVIRVPMPADLLAVPPREWYNHYDRMKQHLAEVLGFRPGFIRARGCGFPGDGDSRAPSWDYYEDLGRLDEDDDEEGPCGFGGWGVYHVRDTVGLRLGPLRRQIRHHPLDVEGARGVPAGSTQDACSTTGQLTPSACRTAWGSSAPSPPCTRPRPASARCSSRSTGRRPDSG